VDVQPLTHRNSDGNLYERLPEVTAQIERALQLDLETLLDQVRISESSSPLYIQEECIVYLIRHFRREKQDSLVNYLAEMLIGRIAITVKIGLRALYADNAADAYNELIFRLFDRILDVQSDRGDFLQVRFWRALKYLTISTYNDSAEREEQDRELEIATVSLPLDEDENEILNRTDSPWEALPDKNLLPEEQAIQAIVIDRVNSLDEPYRTAFVLRYFMHLKLDSQNESELTLSRYFGKPSRTIYNWLTKAEKQLENWWNNHASTRTEGKS
jgi:DNA-directed RNA polymerase specialized sigma24 family protein